MASDHSQAVHLTHFTFSLRHTFFTRTHAHTHTHTHTRAHTDDEGNLNWLAACEVEPATYAMGIRTFKSEPTLTPMVGHAR
jgi:hypothetical protein